ncbi:hypothetical protein CMQ_6508 [Grosmannia clavigera kw1407]|uniref:Uncharacterized protein n=1 Tax=Grosmannia clavigera (strain kw1407 / UAMH 11150) TaxID=655863 RepID=F0X7F8_GROCL|nr:uncharacterized protein CMQ_6508 [Grosmannia clavigera kw1407]EFX06187.1 hypothetical protein CMQ_6508 [Grosmannia clavigera kw1407]
MAWTRQVVGDSDDDEDSVILLRNPQGDIQIGSTAGDSNSTDRSLFRGNYEEQHKNLRSPSDTARRTTDGAHLKTQSDGRSMVDGKMRGEEDQPLDMWDVPSSPEAVNWHGTKRRRGGSHQPDDGTTAQAVGQRLQILISAAGGTDNATATSEKKQAREQERVYTIAGDSFSSIEPTDPSGLGQMHLLGSSPAVQHRLPGSLDHMQDPIGYDSEYERVLPASAAITESTIAYPTPSRYAVLNPQYTGDSNDGATQFDLLHDSRQPTPTRPHAGLSLSEIPPSSPDEIAAPFTVLGAGGPSADDAWEPQDSHNSHHETARPTKQKRRRASDTDELSSAAYMTEHSPKGSEADKSATVDITGERSMPAKAEPMKKKREQGKKNKAKEVIDLSDYNDVDPLTDAPPTAVTTNTGAASSKPKRPRGRPKRQAIVTEPPPQEPAGEERRDESSRGEMGKEKQEQLQKQAAVLADPVVPVVPAGLADLADPGNSSTTSVAPVTATAPVKKPISSISTGQGRVPFRVGLSKRHRIAPLLKSIPKP